MDKHLFGNDQIILTDVSSTYFHFSTPVYDDPDAGPGVTTWVITRDSNPMRWYVNRFWIRVVEGEQVDRGEPDGHWGFTLLQDAIYFVWLTKEDK